VKILNLYSCIGGNRKLWGDNHEITSVEIVPEIAKIYKEYYPNDKIVVGDAHEYLLEHYKEFDFIWASPPCPSHSDIRRCGVHSGQYKAIYPDMKLYEEIIFLTHFAKKETNWVVENVKPYYKLLIPALERGRHLFWSNFFIPEYNKKDKRKHDDITGNSTVYGYNLTKYNIKNKRKILRNMVDPDLALHVLNSAMGKSNQLTFF